MLSESNVTPFGPERDQLFMRQALACARRAFAYDEVPIGAVIVDATGSVIGRGYNRVEKRKCQIAHAEAVAIERATQKRADWRLDGCWIYVTLEPCSMCMSLIQLSRCVGMVYGAKSPLFGYRLDNTPGSPVYKRDAFTIVGGIQGEHSAHLLQTFFQRKRKEKSG